MTSKKRRVLTLLAVTTAIAMVFLDSTVLPVALPTIQKDLGVSQLGLQWIINSYFLATAVFVIAGGRISDLLGHRKMFCYGATIFAISSAFGGFSYSGLWLIISRSFQGLGGALMAPSAMAILVDTFSPQYRGRAMGVLVGVGSLFLSLGPFIGGAFTEFISWRLIFWINLPVALGGILLALSVIPKSEKVLETFDAFGFLTLSFGLFCIILALMQTEVWGWKSPVIITLFILGFFLLILLHLTERFARHPFIDFKLFRNPIYGAGIVIIFFTQFILMMTVFWPIFFQKILFLSPLEAGILTLASTLPIILIAPLSGYLSDHVGPKIPITIGFALLTFCFIWFAIFCKSSRVGLFLPALIPFGSGISLIMTPTSTATLSSVSAQKRGVATGIYNTGRFTGASFGIAVLGSLIHNLRNSNFQELLTQNPLTETLEPSRFWGFMRGVKSSDLALLDLNPETIHYVLESLNQSTIHAYRWGSLVSAFITLISFILVIIFFKNNRINSGAKIKNTEK